MPNRLLGNALNHFVEPMQPITTILVGPGHLQRAREPRHKDVRRRVENLLLTTRKRVAVGTTHGDRHRVPIEDPRPRHDLVRLAGHVRG